MISSGDNSTSISVQFLFELGDIINVFIPTRFNFHVNEISYSNYGDDNAKRFNF
jgi:hypothetical protein